MQGLAGGVARGGSHHHLHGRVQVEAVDDIRAVDLGQLDELADGCHLSGCVAHLDALQRFHVLGGFALTLNHDAVHLTEAVEVGGIQTAVVSLHHAQDVVRFDAGTLTSGGVDVQLVLREAGVEVGGGRRDFGTLLQGSHVVLHHAVEVVQAAARLILHVQLDVRRYGVTRNHRRSEEQYLRFLDNLLCTHEQRSVDNIGILHRRAFLPRLQLDDDRTIAGALAADEAITRDDGTRLYGRLGSYQAVHAGQYLLRLFLRRAGR